MPASNDVIVVFSEPEDAMNFLPVTFMHDEFVESRHVSTGFFFFFFFFFFFLSSDSHRDAIESAEANYTLFALQAETLPTRNVPTI